MLNSEVARPVWHHMSFENSMSSLKKLVWYTKYLEAGNETARKGKSIL